jgi:putative ABC transport system permease protein
MNVLEAIRTSLTEIASHKLRSLLTLVGVILGTTSLVVMVSVIGGLAAAVNKGISDLGFDGVMWVSGRDPADHVELKKRGYSRGLRTSDLAAIESGQELVEAAAPIMFSNEVIHANGRDRRVEVQGITPRYAIVRNRSVTEGRYLVERDVESVAPVAVIGAQLRKDLYGSEEALGREVRVRGVRFRVVGVLRELGSREVQDREMERDNKRIYVPITTMQKHFTGTDEVHGYVFKVRDYEQAVAGEKEVTALIRRSHHGIGDFRVENIGEELLRIRKEIDKLIANWTVVLSSIAGISLLVGGIGIFSVMQISIGERVFEIGLRKSIGASDVAIFGQFLIESVSLSLVGAFVGATLGLGITLLAGTQFEDGLAVSPAGVLMAAGFAIVIGLTAGLYPALRASRMAPVEALRAG